MNILLLKLFLVPFFIGLISFIAKKFGSKWAGIFGGMPVVGAPILIILVLENGIKFGAGAALAAIQSPPSYMSFGLAYCYASQKFNWVISILCAFLVWCVVSGTLIYFNPDLFLSIIISFVFIIVTERLIPKINNEEIHAQKSLNVIIRMLAGVALTLFVSFISHYAGSSLSGFIALYPILGSIMLSSTHNTYGSNEVIRLFNGMSRGAYSIISFFGVFCYMLGKININYAILLSLIAALLTQLIVIKLNKKNL